MKYSILFFAVMCGFAKPSFATGLCEAVAMRDLPALEVPDAVLKKGSKEAPVTQYQVSKKTGEAYFCAHGGYCYPASGLKLLNCKIGQAENEFPDPEYNYFNLEVTRSKVSTSDLRFDDLDTRLGEIGLCSACASSAASIYLNHPKSECGKIVKQALESNPIAAQTLIGTSVCE